MATTAKNTLLDKIRAILKLDDAGKIEKFFKGEVKNFKRNISKIEANLKSMGIQHENNLSDYDEKIEDATDALEAAYENVQLDALHNNEAMKIFSANYWNNIISAEDNLATFQKHKEVLIEEYEKEVEYEKEQIAKYKARIKKLS